MKIHLLLYISFVVILASVAKCDVGLDEDYINKVMEMSNQEFNGVLPQSRFANSSRAATADRFNCQTTQQFTSARSVNALRPSDIEIIASFGDSMTAANGANAQSVLGMLEECRGVSWSIGGEKDLSSTFTIANILKRYSPTLKGFSTGSGNSASPTAGFNTAEAGATSFDILNQAKELIRRINEVPNSAGQWKLVTLFIGGNDLCKYCKDKAKYTSTNYINNIQAALDYLKDNLPRAFVNIVHTLNVVTVKLLNKLTCVPIQQLICSCGLDPNNSDEINNLGIDFQKKTDALISKGRYETSDDFTVVSHTFMTQMTPPVLPDNVSIDFSYFAPDCFHLSRKGHENLAMELWNSMLTPVGKKNVKWTIGQQALCPSTTSPYLFTKRNSGRV